MAFRKASKLAGVALIGALVLAACAGEDGTETPQAKSTPEPPPVCPLTGEDPEVELPRPAVAVKIENSSVAYPLKGLEEAEIVY